MTDKISREMAEDEFERFADAWDIDTDTDDMDIEDRKSFDEQRRKIVKAIMKGHATVSDNGDVTYTPYGENGGDPLTFRIPSGAAYMSMDKYKDRQNMHKMFGFMGSMTKQHSKVFSDMSAIDTKFCMGITLLFLGS